MEIMLALAVVVISYDAVVLGHHQSAELVYDGLSQAADLRASRLAEEDILHHDAAGGIFKTDGTVSLGYGQSAFGRGEDITLVQPGRLAFIVGVCAFYGSPVRFYYAVPVQQGLGERAFWGYADTEDGIAADFHPDFQAVVQFNFL